MNQQVDEGCSLSFQVLILVNMHRFDALRIKLYIIVRGSGYGMDYSK